MDDIDRAIIDLLQQDGRMPNNQLADRVGLSPSPCLCRVRQLEADGVITGYTATLNRSLVGCGYELAMKAIKRTHTLPLNSIG